MTPEMQAEYIVQAIREGASMYEEDARKFLAEHDAHIRAESATELAAVRAERDEALAAVERLKGQRSFLLKQIQKKGARSGEADAALRRFLSGDDEEATS